MVGMQIGIDLGTTSILVYVLGKGIVIREASIAAIEKKTGRILALGNSVYEMVGRNPEGLDIVMPIRDGVISNFTVIHAMIEYYIKRLCGKKFLKPTVMICMPATVTGLERSSILELAISAGAARACLVEEPLAAALGAGLNILEPGGRLVLDIGGGTADAAIITMGSMAIAKSAKVAGNALNASIARHLRRERGLEVGELTAEAVKKKIGCAVQRKVELAIPVRGANYISRLPDRIEVTSTEVHYAMRQPLRDITNLVRRLLEETPPEMAGDIYDNGIVLTGGGAMLRGLDALLARETRLSVVLAEHPLECVARGLGVLMQSDRLMKENSYYYKTDDDIGEFERNRNV
ncbi:MAG: rod shape-determining protein [Oscillospiraceae bacterium]|jgi:rod shape-determining protein MreB|nr:rod shape-determining protein [Oscillospiraceae bacterium]